MRAIFGQAGYRVRFDWGPVGASAVSAGAAVVAVVDVLSFTTALTVAVERGISVLPYRWRDGSAAEAARRHDAVLAVGRSQAGPGQVSLSPDTIARSAGIERLVLPSPNGSTISALLAEAGVTVVGVSLRNARAAAAWAQRRAGDGPIGVVAAGERWPDGSLRPAVEDLWGAGAFLHALAASDTNAVGAAGLGASGFSGAASAGSTLQGSAFSGASFSPEAGAAVAAYRMVSGSVGDALRACAGGLELREAGFGADVEVAAALNAGAGVPVLRDGWFVDGGFDGRDDIC